MSGRDEPQDSRAATESTSRMTPTSPRPAFAAALRTATMAALMAAALSGCERVEPATTSGGTATLTWTAVTRDAQGGELNTLAGYKVFYGTSPRALYMVVVLPDQKLTRYVVHGLAPGSWYFAVAAYTSSNIEGAHSNVVAKTVH